MLANETRAAYLDPEDQKRDRKLFVYNLGQLLKQTREGVTGCYLDNNEIVHIMFKGGSEHTVNVHADSYTAIVIAVAKHVT